MRLLCLCVVVLSGLVAVRCFVFTPEPMKAASNILHGVLANDLEWRPILMQVLNTEVLKSGTMLDDLGLTSELDNGITPNEIIQQLVIRKSTTGSQFMYGIQVLGIALFNQFMKTLMVHSHLALKYADRSEADPMSMRVCISKIQVSLANFANKSAFFGYSILTFKQLNDKINRFLEEHKNMLDSARTRMDKNTRSTIQTILKELFDIAEENVQKATYGYKKIDDPLALDFINDLKLKSSVAKVNNRKIKPHDLYVMVTEIDDYEQVNVSSIGLKFCEKRFNIVKYIPTVIKS